MGLRGRYSERGRSGIYVPITEDGKVVDSQGYILIWKMNDQAQRASSQHRHRLRCPCPKQKAAGGGSDGATSLPRLRLEPRYGLRVVK